MCMSVHHMCLRRSEDVMGSSAAGVMGGFELGTDPGSSEEQVPLPAGLSSCPSSIRSLRTSTHRQCSQESQPRV